jgi:hypothetical protein
MIRQLQNVKFTPIWHMIHRPDLTHKWVAMRLFGYMGRFDGKFGTSMSDDWYGLKGLLWLLGG